MSEVKTMLDQFISKLHDSGKRTTESEKQKATQTMQKETRNRTKRQKKRRGKEGIVGNIICV